MNIHLKSKINIKIHISGFLPPSSGTAIVNGYDIREDISNVRSSLGLCPQHDVLFDTMTVEEHLTFFAKVRTTREFPQVSKFDVFEIHGISILYTSSLKEISLIEIL